MKNWKLDNVMGRKSKPANLLETSIKSEEHPNVQNKPVGTHDSLNIPDYGKDSSSMQSETKRMEGTNTCSFKLTVT